MSAKGYSMAAGHRNGTRTRLGTAEHYLIMKPSTVSSTPSGIGATSVLKSGTVPGRRATKLQFCDACEAGTLEMRGQSRSTTYTNTESVLMI
jgi:hypothetical protein